MGNSQKSLSSTVFTSRNSAEDWIINYQEDEKYPGLRNKSSAGSKDMIIY